MKNIILYTDGACSGNPGKGGWGAILFYGDHKKELSGGEQATTNNRMELTAVIEALKTLKEACHIHLYTDSQYVIKGFNEWLPGWIERGWKNSSKKDVSNVDLWKQLLELTKIHQIKWIWVKGHAGHVENERVDALARQYINQSGMV